ncbi:hypothetical protein SCP_0806250 [Sparassis crispa]|uniref:Uncharacterized protein n=1 Tax=Sparassis crispa TaxID=139825 RepID=A0A401GV42_9APHY|nr:hypothetical protein SCP_0806250 [Sparassis crispa]GBE86101.1 hypothetical protein SCP_0806250 [Sparassis crispa]
MPAHFMFLMQFVTNVTCYPIVSEPKHTSSHAQQARSQPTAGGLSLTTGSIKPIKHLETDLLSRKVSPEVRSLVTVPFIGNSRSKYLNTDDSRNFASSCCVTASRSSPLVQNIDVLTMQPRTMVSDSSLPSRNDSRYHDTDSGFSISGLANTA